MEEELDPLAIHDDQAPAEIMEEEMEPLGQDEDEDQDDEDQAPSEVVALDLAEAPVEVQVAGPRPRAARRGPAPSPTDAPIRISITRDPAGTVRIDSSGQPLPTTAATKGFLPRTMRSRVSDARSRYWSLQDAINRTSAEIPFQAWADAIAEAMIVARSNAAGASTELRDLGQSAYLAMGDSLYKLSPVQLAPQTKALAVARRRMADKLAAEQAAVLATARAQAAVILHSAKEARTQAKEILRQAELTSSHIPPDWVVGNGMTIRFRDDSWMARMPVAFQPLSFDLDYLEYAEASGHEILRRYSWPAIAGTTIKSIAWVPVSRGGEYSVSSIRVDRDAQILPHIDRGSACLSVADAPKELRSLEDYESLRSGINRACQRVQLDSLRAYVSDWLPAFRESMPDELYTALAEKKDWRAAVKLAKKLGAPTVDREREVAETWTTP